MSEVKDLVHSDTFFYHGSGRIPVETEILADVTWGVVQRKRSMFYNRDYGGGLESAENYPNAIGLQIMTRFDIVDFVGRRNDVVSDGTDGNPNRQAATSQTVIKVEQEGSEVDISFDIFGTQFQQPANIQIPSSIFRSL